MMIRRLTVFGLVLVLGCGKSTTRTPEEIEKGKQAVIAALEAWKKNQPSDKDTAFNEDLRKTHSLVEYTLGKVDTTTDAKTIGYSVTVKLKDRKGKEESRELIYLVELGPPLRVSRDPYN